MKMTPEQYESLKADIKAVVDSLGSNSDLRAEVLSQEVTTTMWRVYHEINAQRSYGDEHPRWLTRQRVLSPTHVYGSTWGSELYETLNDSHIETALKKAFSELTF